MLTEKNLEAGEKNLEFQKKIRFDFEKNSSSSKKIQIIKIQINPSKNNPEVEKEEEKKILWAQKKSRK